MPRIMINCPSGAGSVPTGYRTSDIDPATWSHTRAFRCACGLVHQWNEDLAWVETDSTVDGRRHGLEPALPGAAAPPPGA